MSNKSLGAIALFGAPWLLIGFFLEGKYENLSDSWFTGVWGIMYITGWICSIIVLRRLNATGTNLFGRTILVLLLVTLLLANVSNIIQVIVEKNKPSYFLYIDFFWPISNLLMLVVGISVLFAKVFTGWKQYVPLITGIWFPLVLAMGTLTNKPFSFVLGGLYSAIAWTLLALLVLTTKPKGRKEV